MSSLTANRQPLTASKGWSARLALAFVAREGRTVLASRSHHGPLVVQRPFYPEASVCHTYIVHPPGGVVGGDRLELEVNIGRDAHALLTTPAAAKFYRSEREVAQQRAEFQVADGTLEWLPQETIFYPDARVRTATCVRLSGASKFIGWDVVCLGLPAREEPFDAGDVRTGFELWRDEAPLFIDRLQLVGGGDALHAQWGLAGHTALGTMLAWPATRAALAAVRTIEQRDCELAATLVDGVLALRCVGAQAEPIKRVLTQCWRALRPLLLERPAVEPRIWAT